jgi:steroid 5-alpha reductase family enzyme
LMDTSLLLKMVLICLAACAVVMAAVWVWAYRIKNAGVVDIFWAFNFPLIAVILYFLSEADPMRKALICAMVVVWGGRLGFYLLVRVGSHLEEEEGRYKQLRAEWAPSPNAKFFGFFQMQAFSNVFLALPFFLICLNTSPGLQPLEMSGACLWALSVLGEGVADWQLKQFKSKPESKGQVCNIGLWNYSRHPNYFFEWMIWVAYFVFACASPWGWTAIVCPLIILFLLFKVTGIPMTEEQSLRSRGELYKEYQRTTSVFIPLPKKK